MKINKFLIFVLSIYSSTCLGMEPRNLRLGNMEIYNNMSQPILVIVQNGFSNEIYRTVIQSNEYDKQQIYSTDSEGVIFPVGYRLIIYRNDNNAFLGEFEVQKVKTKNNVIVGIKMSGNDVVMYTMSSSGNANISKSGLNLDTNIEQKNIRAIRR